MQTWSADRLSEKNILKISLKNPRQVPRKYPCKNPRLEKILKKSKSVALIESETKPSKNILKRSTHKSLTEKSMSRTLIGPRKPP